MPQNIKQKIINVIQNHPLYIVLGGMFFYIVIFSLISFWKYDNFLYNALDLGIYSQVFDSFKHGQHWYSAIQQSNYLGDHFEPFILILLPFYLLIPHPKTLLVLQTIFLALPAVPIFYIARMVFSGDLRFKIHDLRISQQTTNYSLPTTHYQLLTTNYIPIVVSLFYLINPLVHNINLFEFHLLPFSLIFLFLAAYFYIKADCHCDTAKSGGSNLSIDKIARSPRSFHSLAMTKGSFICFIFFLFLSLLVREDVSMIVFMFGILAILDKRKWYWVVTPMILGVWWFVFSTGIISANNLDGGYKFLTYYNNIFQSSVLSSMYHIFISIFGQIGNWLVVLSLLFIFLFLSIFKSRYLILCLPVALQFLLPNPGAGNVVINAHYTTLFLPALFLSSIYGLKKIINEINLPFLLNRFLAFLLKDKALAAIVVAIIVVGSIVLFGPLGNYIPYVNNQEKRIINSEDMAARKIFINIIPDESSAVLSPTFESYHWKNQQDSSLFWLFKGYKQFSSSPYIPPINTEYGLIDASDVMAASFSLNDHELGDNRIRYFLKERNFYIQDYFDNSILFSKIPSNKKIYEILNSLTQEDDIKLNQENIDEDSVLKLLAFSSPVIQENYNYKIANFSLYWNAPKTSENVYATNIIIRDSKNKIIRKMIHPLGYGILPVNDWKKDEIIKTNHRILLPDIQAGEYSIYLQIINATHSIYSVDNIRSGMVFLPIDINNKELLVGKINVE